eukprot:m.86470 g.86470  ORF g.86470 m.86470 type:complete len:781 (+) comp12811_c0_seq2:111-2453(+)
MEFEEPVEVQRRFRSEGIDVHPTDSALVVFYEVEASVVSSQNEELLGESNRCQKIIRVPSLSRKTNIAALARQIIKKCRYLHPEMQPEIENSLEYLRQRNKLGGKKSKSAEQERKFLDEEPTDMVASLNDLDEYMEMMYEDINSKVKGSKLILQLARNPNNLEEIGAQTSLMKMLTRTMREDGLKSTPLLTNIVSIFFFFSSYSTFHPMLVQYKVGSTCLKIVAQEHSRSQLWQSDLLVLQKKMRQGKLTQEDLDLKIQKTTEIEFKQSQLLYVAFHLLLNLAESLDVETKMIKKNLIEYLVAALDRENYEFLTLIVTFLKKLSIFEDSKDKMVELDVVPRLAALVPSESPLLESYVLRLLLNLSFDKGSRLRMVEVGLVPKLAEMLMVEDAPIATLLTVLYHISMEKEHRHLFAGTEVVPVIMQLMLKSPNPNVELEPISLAINLAHDAKCAAIMSEGKGVNFILKRALRTHDPLLLKLTRALCSHPGKKELLLEFIDPLANQVHDSQDDPDMLVELIGILGCLDIPEFDFQQLADEYDLLPLLARLLLPTAHVADDLVLEAVVLVGTLLTDPACAPMVASTSIVVSLITLLKQKQDDDEIVLQIIYVWNKLLFYSDTREVVLHEVQAVSYLLDLMHDKNEAIRKVISSALDIVAECDATWAREIKMKQFSFHNSTWLENVLGEVPGEVEEGWPLSHFDPHMAIPADSTGPHAQFTQDIAVRDFADAMYGEEGDVYIDDEDDDDEYRDGFDRDQHAYYDEPRGQQFGTGGDYDDGGLWD